MTQLFVNTTDDQNDGSAANGLSLRDAIIIANNDPNNAYVINLTGGATYQLTAASINDDTRGGDLNIINGANVTIVAQGQPATIDASRLVTRDRVVTVGTSNNDERSTLVLNNLIITGGSYIIEGGGIQITRGSQGLITNTIVTGNTSLDPTSFGGGGGGGIFNEGTLTVVNSFVVNNSSTSLAGGISNEKTLFLINTTISDNRGVGLANYASNATATILSSTISSNLGGGIYNFFGTLGLNNTTISSNVDRADDGGAGILVNEGLVDITNSTITNNLSTTEFSDPTQGGGIYVTGGTVNLKNTIVAGNFSDEDPDLAVDVFSSGRLDGQINGNANNLIGRIEQDLGGTLGTGTDLINPNARLGPLQNNGGITLTHALLNGSPAIDRGNNALVSADSFDLNGNGNTGELIPYDQRGGGYPRIVGTVDIGAFEYIIDPAFYGASNPDLIPVFGNNLSALLNHYYSYGIFEGRSTDSFDPYRYVASNTDIIPVFGLNTAAATQHYLTSGYFEGRSTTSFDPARYLNSYDDLLGVYGTNTQVATQHYITSGFYEGRNPNLFPSDRYIASYSDLIQAFSYNLEAGSNHYLFSGRNEGRQVAFDPFSYMSLNPDVAGAFGGNPTLATEHYIEQGYFEGRRV